MDQAVQDNGQPFLDVFSRDPVEVLRPLGVEFDRNVRFAETVADLDLGILQGVSGQERFVLEKDRVLGPASGGSVRTGLSGDDITLRDVPFEGVFEAVLVVDELEFQEGRPADQTFGAGRILDPGKLDDDPIHPLRDDLRLGYAN